MVTAKGSESGSDLPARKDGRVGNRRLRASGADATVKDPSQIVAVKNGLPGENEPLTYRPGRTEPVTEAEALGVIRRRKRAELKKRGVPPRKMDEQLPTELAKWSDAKEPATLRYQPRLRALADAHAEIEGTNFSALIEELLTAHILKPPRDPGEVRLTQERLHAATVKLDRFEERLSAGAGDAGLREDFDRFRAEVQALLGGRG